MDALAVPEVAAPRRAVADKKRELAGNLVTVDFSVVRRAAPRSR